MTSSSAMTQLTARIAELRARRVPDMLAALALQSSDGQQLIDQLGSMLGLPIVRLQDLAACCPRFDMLTFAECARGRCALLDPPTGEDLAPLLVSTDPFDTDMVAWARTRFGRIRVVLASAETFDAWLVHCESSLSALRDTSFAVTSIVREAPSSATAESLSLRNIDSDESPAIRLVNSTLYDALKSGASDVHLECDAAGISVKFRLDGALSLIERVDNPELAERVVSRIKVMALLDIAERRVPQDGRLQITFESRSIDVRVSVMPSLLGEDVVLRILDRRHLAETLAGLTLSKLGFDEATAQSLRALCRRPHGMLLVTGPTGSGKTTTLYAAIAETHQARDKIITIEDPVEYQLPGVLQIPVNERKGLTFARGLRSILRHDPDKILVGEIRDAETAEIAVQSALTGHLVFTTVHANTVFDVLGRFGQFGIDAYTFSAAINGVLAQRLFRRVCVVCAEPLDLETARAAAGELWGEFVDLHGAPRYMRPRGCEHCRGTGYSGRFALGEVLSLTPSLKGLLAARAPQIQIQAEAERNGWKSLRRLALQAAWLAQTSLEEVDRVAI